MLLRILMVVSIINLSFDLLSQEKQYIIENFGTIKVSLDLEVQGGNYKEFQKGMEFELRKTFPTSQSTESIVFQQKGLNEFSSDAFTKFVRIIIKSLKNTSLQQAKGTDPIKMSENEKAEFIQGQKYVAEESAKQTGGKVKGPLTTEHVKIGNYNFLRVKYILSNEQYGDIDYRIHYIPHKGYMHIITTCLSIKDKGDYQNIITNALNSIVLK
jgi:hypothetical protein